ncbi:MAG: magnesium transporter [Kiritimatiellae bacterium]|nr:magnesium transporter [Kiritimatiellia bacterium]
MVPSLKPDILDLIEAGQWNDLRDFLARQPAPEIADLLAAVDDPKHRLILFRLLPQRLADDVFANLPSELQTALLEHMASDEVRGVLLRLSPDDRTALFEDMPARVTRRLLALLPESDRRAAMELLNYPEGSVGRLMTTAYVRVRPDWTREQVLEHIRQWGRDSETLAMLYVTDDRGRLLDDIPLRRVILADPGTRVADMMDHQFAALTAHQGRAQAVQLFRKYDLFAMPVVDGEGMLLGIVTMDDILDVEERESTGDFHRIATVRPLETSFVDAGVGLLVRRRVGWLMALLGINVVSGAGIVAFEDVIAANVALVFFLPLLIDSGGNAASQSATLVIRALAIGDIRLRDWLRMAGRELVLSSWLGLTMAAGVFALGLWRSGIGVATVVAAAMFAVVVLNCLIGVLLPFGLARARLDPAAASVPLITSIADMSGVFIYFLIARSLLMGD